MATNKELNDKVLNILSKDIKKVTSDILEIYDVVFGENKDSRSISDFVRPGSSLKKAVDELTNAGESQENALDIIQSMVVVMAFKIVSMPTYLVRDDRGIAIVRAEDEIDANSQFFYMTNRFGNVGIEEIELNKRTIVYRDNEHSTDLEPS